MLDDNCHKNLKGHACISGMRATIFLFGIMIDADESKQRMVCYVK